MKCGDEKMGEFIDKDRVLRILKRYSTENGSSLGFHSGAVDCVMEEIDMIEPTDVEPVRHGKWIEQRQSFDILGGSGTCTGTYPTCSLCGTFETGLHLRTEFCPGCGAKMDGGDEDARSCGL